MKVMILRNPNGDTRTAPEGVTYAMFQEANTSHIQNVMELMGTLALDICCAGERHDYTKKTYEELFYDDFKKTLYANEDFTESEWYKLHINKERHHLNNRVPEDVDLVDVMEMISDCVSAGLARSGEVRAVQIPDEVLQTAVSNTVKKLVGRCTVVEKEDI